MRMTPEGVLAGLSGDWPRPETAREVWRRLSREAREGRGGPDGYGLVEGLGVVVVAGPRCPVHCWRDDGGWETYTSCASARATAATLLAEAGRERRGGNLFRAGWAVGQAQQMGGRSQAEWPLIDAEYRHHPDNQ